MTGMDDMMDMEMMMSGGGTTTTEPVAVATESNSTKSEFSFSAEGVCTMRTFTEITDA